MHIAMKQSKKASAENDEIHYVGGLRFQWWVLFSVIIILTAVTRFHKVSEPDHVCWDETHFGKMGSWYINRTFFFDVHPPLGKMLIALSGYLTGYDGTFPFEKPGDKYENVNYVGMRVFCTFLGACIIPFAHITVWELTRSLSCSLFASLLLIFDTGMITLNQYILLDPILLFFMSGSIMGMARVKSLGDVPFTWMWWLWLCITGIMLAGAICVKFVGLFVVLLVGMSTIAELWDILGDLRRPVWWTVKHFVARTLTLIVLPALIYVTLFYIHLTVLNRSGNGDGFYSSAFQSRLLGNSLNNASMPRELAYGAVISLKNHRTGGGYLHSHWHLYPEGVGTRQQQVTTYSHKDDNNKWLVKKYDSEGEIDAVELVKSGDLIRLEHVPTKRNLHSHREPAPISKKHFQVTGYGENGTGDANDVWKAVIDGESDGTQVLTVTSKLRFIHLLQHCALTCSGKQLPKWGYEQQEVSCNPNLRDRNSFWNIEDNIFSKLPNVSFEVYAPTFIERLIESHAVMLQGNAGLKPKEGEVTSRPWQWPINYRGQFFSGNDYKIYLLGNPIIWWGNLILLPITILFILFDAADEQRNGISGNEMNGARKKIANAFWWLFIGWMLHYFPFWVMGRVLYFHHYFPALYFNSMMSGVVLGYLIDCLPLVVPHYHRPIKHFIVGAVSSGIVYSFLLFAPLTYGIDGSPGSDGNSSISNLRWLDTWEF